MIQVIPPLMWFTFTIPVNKIKVEAGGVSLMEFTWKCILWHTITTTQPIVLIPCDWQSLKGQKEYIFVVIQFIQRTVYFGTYTQSSSIYYWRLNVKTSDQLWQSTFWLGHIWMFMPCNIKAVQYVKHRIKHDTQLLHMFSYIMSSD